MRIPRPRPILALTSATLIGTLMLAGCSTTDTATTSAESSAVSAAPAAAESILTSAEVLAANQEVHDTADATTYDESTVVDIALGADPTVDGASTDAVSVDREVVTITTAGTYRLSGTLDDGSVVVNSTGEGTVRIILDDAELTSTTGSPLVITEADSAVVLLAEGSTNSLTDAATYADGDATGALSSAADLTLAGTGSLSVTGSANDGIVSADGLVIADGDITVDAVDDGIRGKDYLVVAGGTIDVTAGGDGLKSDNEEDAERGFVAVSGGTIDVTAGGDGVQAQTDAVVAGGSLTVTSAIASSSDDAAAKGITSEVLTVIDGGDVVVDATDDALHGNGVIHLGGGTVRLSSGDDGVHAETALYINGGVNEVVEAVEGLESADITIVGGDTTVTASDDGVNASSGSTSATTADPAAAATGGPGAPPADGEFPGGRGDFGGGGGGAGEIQDVSITIAGGTLEVNADGDGLDSNGTMTITGGDTVVNGPSGGGNGALDVNGEFTVSGGTLLASGSAGMVVSPAATSSQGWISATLDATASAGTTVAITDADGTELTSFVAEKDLASVVWSSADVTGGESYTVLLDGAPTATVPAGEAAAGGRGGPRP